MGSRGDIILKKRKKRTGLRTLGKRCLKKQEEKCPFRVLVKAGITMEKSTESFSLHQMIAGQKDVSSRKDEVKRRVNKGCDD